MGADLTKTTISGLSSGGSMAVQMQVIFSDKVIGSGIIAGMPFNCMQGDIGNFKKCHDASQINLQTLESLTD